MCRGASASLLALVRGTECRRLLATSVWFRCRDLSRVPGINGDEAWYGAQAELVLRGVPVAWRTPTGNLLNPFFFGPVLLLHAIWPPSFGLLRATALASGLLTLLANYWLCRGVFGRRVAWISTLILAVLPINIVYSRLAWDASQSVLATLPAIYWPLRAIVDPRRKVRWSGLGLAALAAAIVVHPTNLFVSGVTGICLGFACATSFVALNAGFRASGSGLLECERGSSWPRAEGSPHSVYGWRGHD